MMSNANAYRAIFANWKSLRENINIDKTTQLDHKKFERSELVILHNILSINLPHRSERTYGGDWIAETDFWLSSFDDQTQNWHKIFT